jgi:hypothetical protein
VARQAAGCAACAGRPTSPTFIGPRSAPNTITYGTEHRQIRLLLPRLYQPAGPIWSRFGGPEGSCEGLFELQIVDEYVEVESAKGGKDRPELAKALSAARLHRASLVVSKVDRLTRSVAFLSRLLEAGVDVRFSDLPQIEGATGRFMLQQMVAVAELEAGMISARTKAALAAAKKRGKKLGGLRRKIVGKDAKGRPIYGDVVSGGGGRLEERHCPAFGKA